MLVIVRGAGDVASGIALRLHRSGYRIVMTELPAPIAIRRTVSFSEAIRLGQTQVEGVTARRVDDPQEALSAVASGQIAVVDDPQGEWIALLRPDVVVDAILAKKNLGTAITDAPVVIGAGPGFTAGVDCHAAVETMRGHTLGRVLYTGSPLPNTGMPGIICGMTDQRVLRAPAGGIFRPQAQIGDMVRAGQTAATVSGVPMLCAISGCLRGLLPPGAKVFPGMKCGDVDPRAQASHCTTVSDKALAVGGGVLEALLHFGALPR